MKNAFFLALVLFYPFGAYALHADLQSHGSQTKHYEESLFKVTEKGLFSVEMIIKGKELKTGVNTLDVIVHDKDDKDVVGAEVSVSPWMPDMGHGVFEKPVITERGGGLYSAGNVILIMGGHWELRVQVKKDGLEDKATFDFPDVKVGGEHEMTGATSPSDLDLSTTRFSAHKIFKVSFRSKLDPVVINKIHSWELSVETPEGVPVSDAKISIDGGMPQHGHGLPTQPEVEQEPGSGTYLVGGVKFSMPGWWVVNFHIKAENKEDTVTFNLLVK
jgi:hypothetical protein